ncbi:hypothetical protein DA075_25645 [Methylobacterium currus]|uniref:ATPase AAA-type core domain-containing protein n=2 Tax=Methylobacterium currus TaxID=2051553 RepID=A0A2R4WU78_9HYPH|nr:hypothetical protein DA075_25645 [Methylobacterium currus]
MFRLRQPHDCTIILVQRGGYSCEDAMLRSIECSGFKSFDNFNINFKPGLNVIVGPNGSGKTNIILFLQFLSSLRRSPIIEAIGQIGGAGSAFRRAKFTTEDEIDFRIVGSGIYNTFDERKIFSGNYDYSATVSFSKNEGTIIFKKQRLKTFIDKNNDPGLFSLGDLPPTFDVETKVAEDGQVITTIHALNPNMLRYSARNDEEVGRAQIKDASEHLSKTYSMLGYLDRIVDSIDFPGQDLRGARSYNILPYKVREPEDIANSPFIEPDGSGLAATLYALQTEDISIARRYAPIYYSRPSYADAELMRKQIIDSGRLVNDAIVDIRVQPDPFESKLRITVDLDYGENLVRLPFSMVSDGTAKWYALVTAVVTNRRLFAIEEPENFLHPHMQSEIIKLLRNQYSASVYSDEYEVDKFAIITTHSETILNNCKPDELIIVNLENGRTVTHRTENSDDLSKEIKRTGFGLGYYYLAGAVE